MGVPIVTERERCQQTGDLCLKVVAALGVEGVSFRDTDAADQGAVPRCLQETKRRYL